MIDSMPRIELVDIISDDGAIVGTMSRDEAEYTNQPIQNVCVFVFNSLEKVWIQKRPMKKKHFPGLWDVSACGAVESGEDIAIAAQREQEEEMGFRAELSLVESFINEFPGQDNQTWRRLSHLFVGESDEIPQSNDEVDEFAAWPFVELRQKIALEPEKFIPSFLVELDKAVKGWKKLKGRN